MLKPVTLAALGLALASPALLLAGLPTGSFEGPDLWTDPAPAEYRIKAAGTDLCVTRDPGTRTALPHMVLRRCASPIGFQAIALAPNGTSSEALPMASPVTWRMTTPFNSNCLTAARGVVFGPPAVDEIACAETGVPARRGGVDQSWRLRHRGPARVFEIRTLDGRCWTAQGAVAREGVQVVLERCNDLTGGQQWLIDEPTSWAMDSANTDAAFAFGWVPVGNPGSSLPARFRLLRQLNLPSGDYTAGIPTADDEGETCAQLCAEDSQCRAFTWVDPRARGGQAMCYKKNLVNAPVADNFTNSGIVRPR